MTGNIVLSYERTETLEGGGYSYGEWFEHVRRSLAGCGSKYAEPGFADHVAAFCWESFRDGDCDSLEASLSAFYDCLVLDEEYEIFNNRETY